MFSKKCNLFKGVNMELNKEYSMTEIAVEMLGISYGSFKAHKEKYEKKISEYYE